VGLISGFPKSSITYSLVRAIFQTYTNAIFPINLLEFEKTFYPILTIP